MARWLGIGCWLTLILFNSSISASPAPVPSFVSFLVAKAGHIVEYTLLGWLLARALVAATGGFGLQPRSAWLVTVVFGVSFAILDEIRQYFVQGRTGQGGDVLLDVDGAVRCVYRSSEPANRPSVDEILNQLSP